MSGARDRHTRGAEATSGGPLAFVLAGGGSLGAVQVGMLLALAEAGIRPDLVIGSSVGAINATHHAARPSPEGVRRLADFWTRLHRRRVFPLSPLRGALGVLNRRPSLLRSSALRAVLTEALPCRDLSETAIPCHVVATDMMSGEAVMLTRGDAIEALLASTAIPAIFPPVAIEGRWLMDGAIGNIAPLTGALALGARRIVVIPTGLSCAATTLPSGPLGVLLRSVSLVTMRQLTADIARVSGAGVRVAVVPPLCPLTIAAHDFSHAAELIGRSHQATQEWLLAGGMASREVPMALLPHDHGTARRGS